MEINKFFIKHDIRQEQKGIAELASDIKAHTLLQPIIVQAVGGEYEILDGRRRFYALRDYLRVDSLEEKRHYIVREGLDALAAQFAANENRQDFTPYEKAALIAEIHQKGVDDHGVGIKLQDIADGEVVSIGRPPTHGEIALGAFAVPTGMRAQDRDEVILKVPRVFSLAGDRVDQRLAVGRFHHNGSPADVL